MTRPRQLHKTFSTSVPALLALACAGCNTPGGAPLDLAPEINSSLNSAPLLLAPGDLLDVRFTQQQDWNHETRIRPDGRASFLSIDDVETGGLTVEQLDAALTEAYGGLLQQPELTVFTKELSERSVAVMGEVNLPGARPLEGGRLSLIEALAQAGGPKLGSSYPANTMLIRWLPEEQRRVVYKIDARPEMWDGAQDVLLRPYDVVFVPSKKIVDVNIWINQYIEEIIPSPFYFIPFFRTN